MLSALEENKRKKADKYWPDEEKKIKRISNAIELGRSIAIFLA